MGLFAKIMIVDGMHRYTGEGGALDLQSLLEILGLKFDHPWPRVHDRLDTDAVYV